MVAVKITLLAFMCAFIAQLDCNFSLYFYNLVKPASKIFDSKDEFFGKNFWVTGASSGIGRDLAFRLATVHRANVIVSGRRSHELQSLKDEIENVVNSGAAKIIPFDQTDDDDVVIEAVKAAISAFGGVDVLVLNAGLTQRLPALKTPIGDTRKLINLNFASQVLIAQQLILLDNWETKGNNSNRHIVVTSSVAGKLPVALSSSYAASKAALNGYFQSLRSELPWLRVDLVCPGPVATDIHLKSITTKGHNSVETKDRKMSVERHTSLLISQMKNFELLSFESWISPQPVLLFTAIGQYMPTLTFKLSKIVGVGRVNAFINGGDVYDFKKQFFGF
ncbi:hypothetical protein ScalyP_jg9079 [Parmales sp. scaly parma]|nr:hypothetical protein ScalyP_jg9079 [Parmales sp. scaly parma]